MENEYKYGKKVTIVGTVANIILSLIKLIVGFISGSLALIADGFHSLSDLASDVVVFVGLSFAEKPDDSSHHFGHGKFETFSAFLVGVFLAAAGFFIGKDSAEVFWDVYHGMIITAPGIEALFVTLVSVILKEVLYRYTRRAGEKIKSPSIIANAWHHRSDSFSSIGAFLGIAGAIFLGGKWVILDPLAGIIVALILIKEAFSIIKENLSQLLDVSLGVECTNTIQTLIKEVSNCSEPHSIRTRSAGKRVVISLHIRVDDNLTIKKGHEISHVVEDKLKKEFGVDTIVTVHVEPESGYSETLQK